MVIPKMDECEQAQVIAVVYERLRESLPETGEFLYFLAGQEKIENLLDLIAEEIKEVLAERNPKRLC